MVFRLFEPTPSGRIRDAEFGLEADDGTGCLPALPGSTSRGVVGTLADDVVGILRTAAALGAPAAAPDWAPTST